MNSFPILQEYMKSSRAGRFEEQHLYVNILSRPYIKPFQPDRILLLYAKRRLLQKFPDCLQAHGRTSSCCPAYSSLFQKFPDCLQATKQEEYTEIRKQQHYIDIY